MSITRSHETAIIATPATLKHQIITRLNTLVNKVGGGYFPTDNNGVAVPIAEIEALEVYGLETKGRDVYLMTVNTEQPWNDEVEGYIPYNANEFYLEQLWDVYTSCEPIYQSKMVDYGTMQD